MTTTSKTVEVFRIGDETMAKAGKRVIDEQKALGWQFVTFTPSESRPDESHYYEFKRDAPK